MAPDLPPAAVSERAREQLRRPLDTATYDEIRELWKRHSIAEENRDLPGLIATLTHDCVYEIPGWEKRWDGHAGATAARPHRGVRSAARAGRSRPGGRRRSGTWRSTRACRTASRCSTAASLRSGTNALRSPR